MELVQLEMIANFKLYIYIYFYDKLMYCMNKVVNY
jgi:hypothetical protein